MKISELIIRLQEFKAAHGDLPCICHDGLPPSEPALVVDVELETDLNVGGSWVRLFARICS